MKTNKLIITLFMVLLIAGLANALQVGSATIGDDKQDRVENVSTTFQITNNGTVALTDITITSNADSKYNIEFTNKPTTLDIGASATVTVTGKIPLAFDAVDRQTLEEKAFSIGTITVKGKEGAVDITETSDLKMQAVNQLEIRKVKVKCDSEEESLDDGEKMENLKPDMNDCIFYVKIENDFNENDKNDQKIGDIEIDTTVEVESDSSDIDLDESDDISSFDADDYEEITFDFDIDEEADDGTTEVTLRVYGVDENGAYHGEKWIVKLEIERLKHDVQIKKVSIIPTEVETCQEDSIKIAVTLYNMGRRDEGESAVQLSLPDFKFTKKIEDIELDRDDTTTLNFDVQLPLTIKEGLYRGTLKSYFDNLAESDTQTIQIKVIKCSTEIEPDITKEDNKTTTIIVPTQPQIPPTIPKATTGATAETKESFTESSAYLGLLTAFVVLLLIAIVVIGVIFFVKKK